jgi:hypothetical protein
MITFQIHYSFHIYQLPLHYTEEPFPYLSIYLSIYHLLNINALIYHSSCPILVLSSWFFYLLAITDDICKPSKTTKCSRLNVYLPYQVKD